MVLHHHRTLDCMEVTVLLFGPAAMAAGARQVAVKVAHGCTSAELRAAMLEQHAALRPVMAWGRVVVNHAYSPPGTVIRAGDEVALIALVSGG
jgi:molybdopterin converting factor small subunit